MPFKNFVPEFLIFVIVMAVLVPLSFIGLDFTDTGYHFVNQLHGFDIPRVWQNTAYYPLSDFLVHAVLTTAGAHTLMAYRLCGAVIWGLNAALALRFFHLAFGAGVVGASVLVPAVLLSIKPFAAGVPILANYESVPICLLLLSLILMRKNSLLNVVTLPFMILARSTTILEAGLIAVYDFFYGTGKSKPHVLLLLGVSAGTFGALKWGLIAHFASIQTIGANQIQTLYQAYQRDAVTLIVILECVLAASVAAYAFYQRSWKWIGVGLLAAGISGFSSILFDQSELILNFQWLLVLFSTVGLWVFWPGQRKDWAFLLGIFALFFVGSDTGIQKSGFLSFLLVAPALSLGVRWLSSRRARITALVLIQLASGAYLYASLFRVSWTAILNSPVIMSDPQLGTLLVSKTDQEIWTEFRVANTELSARGPTVMVVGSNGPLLTVLTSLYKISPPLIWSEIKPKELVRKEIASLCQQEQGVILALAKVDLTSPERGGYNPFSSPVADAAQAFCSITPIHETNYFMFWSLSRPNR